MLTALSLHDAWWQCIVHRRFRIWSVGQAWLYQSRTFQTDSLHCEYATCYNIHNTKSNDRLVSILRKGLLRYIGHFGAFLLRSMQNWRVFSILRRVFSTLRRVFSILRRVPHACFQLWIPCKVSLFMFAFRVKFPFSTLHSVLRGREGKGKEGKGR